MKKLISILILLLALVCVLAACDTEPARSITKSEIVDGELILTYSDGTTENLGKVVGADGEKGDKGGDGKDLTDDNPQGLDFFLLPDGTYAVSVGNAIYLEEIIVPETYKGKPVTCVGMPPNTNHDLGELNGIFGFTHAPYLKKIILPNSITYIGEDAFDTCRELSEVVLPSNLISIGESAFYRCTSLTSIEIPASVTSIGYEAFSGCTGLIQKENGVSYVDKWGIKCDTTVTNVTLRPNTVGFASYAFYNCTSLTSIEIPASVTSIGDGAFSNCGSLTSVTFAENSQLSSIGDYAFYYCTSLTSIEIPASVTSIGEWAFEGCTSLTSATFAQTSGWKYLKVEALGSYYISISVTDLADPATAARYLRSTYDDYYWKRS